MLKKNFETYYNLKEMFANKEELINFLDMCIIVASETGREDAIKGINYVKQTLGQGGLNGQYD